MVLVRSKQEQAHSILVPVQERSKFELVHSMMVLALDNTSRRMMTST